MKTEGALQNATADAINKLSAFLSSSADWAASQIPDLANQILVYGLAKSIFFICAGIIIIVVSYFYAFKWVGQNLDSNNDWRLPKFAATLVGSSASIFALGVIYNGVVTIIKITLAPKIYVIEYVLQFTN